MSNLWEYYDFEAVPYLSTRPLSKSEDLDMFLGRVDELRVIKMYLDSGEKVCLLITGAPGIGKTTFICKAFQEEKGFIRVNLSRARNIDEADAEIARACIVAMKRCGINIKEFDNRIKQSTSTITGRNMQAGGLGIGVQSIYQQTEAPLRNYEVEDIIKVSFEKLSKKTKRVVLGLDESDFLGTKSHDDLCNLCQRMKELIPEPGVLILANRDEQRNFKNAYTDLNSLVRTIFDNHELLKHFWKPGEGDVQGLLEPRFERGKPTSDFSFPLSKNACYWIDIFSNGNIRELLRYTNYVLMKGADKKQKIPLQSNFVIEQLNDKFFGIEIEDPKEIKILKYLRNKPTSVADKNFQNATFSRSTLQRHLINLEKRWLVGRDHYSPRKIQTFQITKLAEVLLDLVI